MKATVTTALVQLKSHGFTYEYFHGPAQPGREQGLAQSSHDKDMAGVVKEITYGDLWGSKKASTSNEQKHVCGATNPGRSDNSPPSPAVQMSESS